MTDQRSLPSDLALEDLELTANGLSSRSGPRSIALPVPSPVTESCLELVI